MTNSPSFLIENIRQIDPSNGTDSIGTLFVHEGKLCEPQSIDATSSVRVDGTGLVVCPGFIDVHVHLREPGYEEAETIETGAAAAACGGFTHLVAMPNTTPALDNPEILLWLRHSAQKVSPVTILPSVCISAGRAGIDPVDYTAARAAGAVAITDDGSTPASTDLMRHAAEQAALLNLPILDHAEDSMHSPKGVMHEGAYSMQHQLPGIPSEVEISIVKRDIELAEKTGAHFHIQHISARESLDLIKDAQDRDIPITAEATPHHLALCDADVDPKDASFKMNPPLRSEADRRALRQAVAAGIITLFATDHAPHTIASKQRGFATAPFGIIGLETALGITYTHMVKSGIISLMDWIKCWTSAPAKLLHLPPPSLQMDTVADLTIFDPEATWCVTNDHFASKSSNSPFIGSELANQVMATIHHGRLIYATKHGVFSPLNG